MSTSLFRPSIGSFSRSRSSKLRIPMPSANLRRWNPADRRRNRNVATIEHRRRVRSMMTVPFSLDIVTRGRLPATRQLPRLVKRINSSKSLQPTQLHRKRSVSHDHHAMPYLLEHLRDRLLAIEYSSFPPHLPQAFFLNLLYSLVPYVDKNCIPRVWNWNRALSIEPATKTNPAPMRRQRVVRRFCLAQAKRASWKSPQHPLIIRFLICNTWTAKRIAATERWKRTSIRRRTKLRPVSKTSVDVVLTYSSWVSSLSSDRHRRWFIIRFHWRWFFERRSKDSYVNATQEYPEVAESQCRVDLVWSITVFGILLGFHSKGERTFRSVLR